MRIPTAGASVVLGFLLLPPQYASSQTVQGQLLDRETGAPVEGALVLLLSASGNEITGSLSNASGRFLLRGGAPGLYTVRAERIGYETTSSETIRLSQNQVLNLTLETGHIPIRLEDLKVEGEQKCVVRPEEGLLLASVWEEARKALKVQDWTDREGLYRFQMESYERELDVSARKVESETRRVTTFIQRSPIRSSLTAAELMTDGFIRRLEEGFHLYEYHGPDAAILMSDEFLDTHCFRLKTNPEEPQMAGVSFEPARRKGIPDILGTLWVDVRTGELKFLEYEYTWAAWPEAKSARDDWRSR